VASALGITIQELIQPFVVAAVAGSTKAPTRGGRMAPRRAVAPKRRRASKRTSETLEIDLEVVEPRKRYPHEGGIKPKEIVGTILLETPFLRDLTQHP
jgi:hypothetical protein